MDKLRRRFTAGAGALALLPVSRAFSAPVGSTAELVRYALEHQLL